MLLCTAEIDIECGGQSNDGKVGREGEELHDFYKMCYVGSVDVEQSGAVLYFIVVVVYFDDNLVL